MGTQSEIPDKFWIKASDISNNNSNGQGIDSNNNPMYFIKNGDIIHFSIQSKGQNTWYVFSVNQPYTISKTHKTRHNILSQYSEGVPSCNELNKLSIKYGL